MSSRLTLITDFGTCDSYAAEMEGVIRSAGDLDVSVLTHDVPPGDVWHASYFLMRAVHSWPAGTVHLAVVDPGVGTDRAILVGSAGTARIVCPDNGLITFIRPSLREVRSWKPPRDLIAKSSATFHGRDIFAPLAASLARGADPGGSFSAVDKPILLPYTPPARTEDGWRGTIVHLDRFGNAISDIPISRPGGVMRIGSRRIARWSISYAHAPDGEPFLCIGSFGTVEISVNLASGAELSGIQRGAGVTLSLEAGG